MAIKIRLSPSGPVIGDAGPAFQLRTVGSNDALTSTPVVTVLGPLVANGGNITPMLSAPVKEKSYSVRGHFYVDSFANGGEIGAFIQLSYDGVVWFTETGMGQNFASGPALVAPGNEPRVCMSVYMPPTLGSALATPMTDADLEIWARLAVIAGANGDYSIPFHPEGNFGIELTEYANP